MATAALLKEQLGHFKFECSAQVERLVRAVFEKIEARSMEIAPLGVACTSYWHPKSPGKVAVAMRQVERPDLCVNPVLVLDVHISETR
ncbi:hypothetical protein MFIFM68171_06526 [Madurella fahalii]|uniref:Uncharacterized protein n=1 Tax=Madurella fahalii TaxID=1157608 RepID=A0ABQ0GEY4_9PEZI